ncbi:hypothetical protein HK104_000146 [Borealophlyctis nickersoniae]|nr:hypothetical protein HK104_000146 [Borealophlyctis nickersoniae]
MLENPLLRFPDTCILDGGLATELETGLNKDLSGSMWSARLLKDDVESIKEVHMRYFQAGADVATTASYQGSLEGFQKTGCSIDEAKELLRLSVRIAVETRDRFVAEASPSIEESRPKRPKPLVAASIGSYGAFLANGAEYTGDYDPSLTHADVASFHASRAHTLLSEPGVDILAFETIPSLFEAQSIAQLCQTDRTVASVPAWVSFSCRDDTHIAHGETLAECVRALASVKNVVAVGVNCTKPEFVAPLLQSARKVLDEEGSSQVLICYPNSGEVYDGTQKRWLEDVPGGSPGKFAEMAGHVEHISKLLKTR